MLNTFNDITEKTFIKSYGSPLHMRVPVHPHIHLYFCHQFLVYDRKPTILFKLFWKILCYKQNQQLILLICNKIIPFKKKKKLWANIVFQTLMGLLCRVNNWYLFH